MKYSGGMSFHRVSHTKKRVLILSENPRVLAEIKKGLMESFDVVIASASEPAITAFCSRDMDAVIIHKSSDNSPFASFEGIIGRAVKKGVPVLILADSDNEQDEETAFSMGASDYSVKRSPVSGAFLGRLKCRIQSGEYARILGVNEMAALTPVPIEDILSEKTILIAEDVALNRDVIGAMLSQANGVHIDFASNGIEAVEMFEKNIGLYSLIFMDIYMPEMDGLNAARAIRCLGHEAARKIPIIALTASTSETDIEDFLEAGMDGYLEKPLDYDEFLKISAEFLYE